MSERERILYIEGDQSMTKRLCSTPRPDKKNGHGFHTNWWQRTRGPWRGAWECGECFPAGEDSMKEIDEAIMRELAARKAAPL